MLNEPRPYRWQDHTIPPHRTAASLMATALVVLAVGAAGSLLASGPGAADPPSPPAAKHAAVSERTPPLCQLARRPGQPPHTHTKPSPL